MKLFVTNLRYDCTEEDFRKLCEQYGRVVYATLPKNRETEQGRGFAFVKYAEEGDYAGICEKMDGVEFQGRRLRAEPARPRTSKPEAESA
jgi:RNA recognition motif-containing protein